MEPLPPQWLFYKVVFNIFGRQFHHKLSEWNFRFRCNNYVSFNWNEGSGNNWYMYTCYVGLVSWARCNKIRGLPCIFSSSFLHFAPHCDADKTNQNYLTQAPRKKSYKGRKRFVQFLLWTNLFDMKWSEIVHVLNLRWHPMKTNF